MVRSIWAINSDPSATITRYDFAFAKQFFDFNFHCDRQEWQAQAKLNSKVIVKKMRDNVQK